MKKSCLIYIALFVGLAMGVFLYVYWRFPDAIDGMKLQTPPPEWFRTACAVGVSFPAAFFTSMGLGFLQGVWQKLSERSLISHASRGSMMEDGKKNAAVGVIRPVGPPLTAPISGSACVAFDYEIYHLSSSSRSHSRIKDFHGFSLTPSIIHTAAGPVRLLAYPDLDFREDSYSDEEAYQRARRYINETNFIDMNKGLAAIGKAFSEMKDILTDDDGCIKKDWANVDKNYDIRKDRLVEKRVDIGEKVCAFGIYSAERGGLVPKWVSADILPVRLMKGEASNILRTLTKRIIGSIIGSAIFLAIAVAIVEGFFHFLPDFVV